MGAAGAHAGARRVRQRAAARAARRCARAIDLQRASDDTYLRRYGFGDEQALFSRAYLEQADGRNFALAEGLAIQGLRATDSGKTTPLVLPILQGYYETPA